MGKIKGLVTSTPILVFPDDTQTYRVEADGLDFATGATLSQQSPVDDKWHPVAFLSKSLSPVEQNYEIHDKEMLAIIRALEEWQHFLEGTPQKIEIWTDHKNLEYFRTLKKLNWRQARWSSICHALAFPYITGRVGVWGRRMLSPGDQITDPGQETTKI